MAYAYKYIFRFESIHGVEHVIAVLQDGYSGSIKYRPLGGAPVLKKQRNGAICGTTLEFKAECQTDLEFAEFYTSNPKEYYVELWRGTSFDVTSRSQSNSTMIWNGFMNTEIYSAPEIAPPYDVNVIATDGLGELKLYDYEAQGTKTVAALLHLLLYKTGMHRTILFASSLRTVTPTSGTAANFLTGTSINLDYMEGKSYYDVLSALLTSIGATIEERDGKWFISREADQYGTYSGSSFTVYQKTASSSSVSSTTLTDRTPSIGQMGVANMWPIGHLNVDVEPAKYQVVVEAPWHTVNAAPSVSDDEWTADSGVTRSLNGYVLANGSSSETISANLSLLSFQKNLSLKIYGNWTGTSTTNGDYGEYAVIVKYATSAATLYYDGSSSVWRSTLVAAGSAQLTTTNSSGDADVMETLELEIPNSGASASGTLTISILGVQAVIFNVEATFIMSAGFKDVIKISNGARGADDTIEIVGGRVDSDSVCCTDALQGIFLTSGNPVLTWADSNFTSGLTFLSLMAMDRAACVALPRIWLSGTADFPSSRTYLPIVFSYDGVYYWIDTYEYDLLNEDFSFKALSYTSVSLTVESETITSIASESSSSSSGSSGGGGGGGSTSMAMEDLTNVSVSGVSDGQVLAWDDTNNQWVNATVSGSGTITIDSALSSTSTNPVQNAVIYAAIGDIETLLAAL